MALAKVFPKHHPRAGEPTHFADKIRKGEKIHTIRTNFPYWEKKIKKIQEGNAQLIIFEWEGKPYRSKQKNLYIITKDRYTEQVKVIMLMVNLLKSVFSY